MEDLIDGRLKALSTKPRKINHHTETDTYCLPYETRLSLDEQRLKDSALFDEFTKSAEIRLQQHLELHKVQVSRASYLLSQVFNQIFRRQGLDFADFVLHQKDPKVVEQALPDVISTVLETGGVPPTIKHEAGAALLGAARDLIYHGSTPEREYLKRLSCSYMVLFVIQCDPHVCQYFDTLAAKLKVFVCNSILVPTLSEIWLAPENRRHWNLLVQARNAGVKLFLNKVTLLELVTHIKLSIQKYNEEYKGLEHIYSDERTLRYVNPIIVRAYLYVYAQGNKITFEKFLDKFVSPRATNATMAQELITFLLEEFGIEYINDAASGVVIDSQKCDLLVEELQKLKKTLHQAQNDAKTILTIYGLREKNNESATAGIFGYQTWWLSKDTTTHRAVRKCFKDASLISCYLRPDFLLNYIALSVRGSQASKVFDQMFPTLIGVSLSHHVTDELNHEVHEAIKRHQELSSARVKSVIGSLTTQLMSEAHSFKGKSLKKIHHLLEDAFAEAPKFKARDKH